MVVCRYCKFFFNRDPDSPRANVWYNHLCKASPLDPATDPVTGIQVYLHENSLGMSYVTQEQFQFCRNVNHGDCGLFESIVNGWQVADTEVEEGE